MPAAVQPRRRLGRHLVTAHIISSVALLGTDASLLVLGLAGRTGSAPSTVYPAMSLLATWLIGPLAVLALGSGIAVATVNRWGLFRHGWVTVKLVVTAVLTTLVLVLVRPGLGRAADAALRLTTDPVLSPGRMTLFAIVPAAALALLIGNVLLGRYRPGEANRRTRASRANG